MRDLVYERFAVLYIDTYCIRYCILVQYINVFLLRIKHYLDMHIRYIHVMHIAYANMSVR